MINKEQSLLHMQAYKLAFDGINNKKDISTELGEVYQGGVSAGNQEFGNVFTTKCANVAVSRIVDNPSGLEDTVGRFYKSILPLNDDHIALAFDKLKNALKKQVPEFVNNDNELKDEVKKQIVNATQIRLVNSNKP